MNHASMTLGFTLLLLASCTSTKTNGGTYVQADGYEPVRVDGSQPIAAELPPESAGAPTASPQQAGARRAVAVDASSTASGAPRATSAMAEPSIWSADQLSIWRSPAFKKRFVESFAADVNVEPGVTSLEVEQLEKIFDLIANDKTKKALELLRKHGGPGASAVFDFTLGGLSFQSENYEQAAKHYERAVAKYPNYLRAWRFLGISYVRVNDFEQALPALTRVVQLGGTDAINYGLLGFAYLSAEDSLSAETSYRMALLLDPETMDWKQGLARALFKQARYAEAAALCGTLIRSNPDQAEFWLLQAGAYIGLEQPLKAAENYEIVDRLGKATAENLQNLGNIYLKEDLFSLAGNCYLRALEKDPDLGTTAALFAARVMSSRGALGEMTRVLDGLEALRGETLAMADQKSILKLRARQANADGATEMQVQLLEETVALDPLDGEALLLLAKHHRLEGEGEKAVFYFERAANLEDYEADAKVGHAQLLVGQGKLKEALPMLVRAQALKPRENVQEFLEQVQDLSRGR